jgi:hypothetical protein
MGDCAHRDRGSQARCWSYSGACDPAVQPNGPFLPPRSRRRACKRRWIRRGHRTGARRGGAALRAPAARTSSWPAHCVIGARRFQRVRSARCTARRAVPAGDCAAPGAAGAARGSASASQNARHPVMPAQRGRAMPGPDVAGRRNPGMAHRSERVRRAKARASRRTRQRIRWSAGAPRQGWVGSVIRPAR